MDPDTGAETEVYQRFVTITTSPGVPRAEVEFSLIEQIRYDVPSLSLETIRDIVRRLEWRKHSVKEEWSARIFFRYITKLPEAFVDERR